MHHRTFARSPQGDGLRNRLKTVGILVLVTGLVVLFVQTYIGFRSATTSAAAGGSSSALQQPHKLAPLIPESGWGRWHKGEIGYTFPSTQLPFTLGQTVVIPNQVAFQVDRVDRNWEPQAWQQAPYPTGGQDDANGKEVILVRFTITNLSQTPIDYLFDYFSLVRVNGHEQRVATLNDLTPDQYGAFGSGVGWLQPGVTKHTFVPFLVNPGEQPRAFVFSLHQYQPIASSPATAAATPGKGGDPQQYIPIARIVVALPTHGTTTVGTSQQATATQVTFVPDMTFKVTKADVYS